MQWSEVDCADLLEVLQVGTFITDARGYVVHANAKYREITGLSESEMLGMGWLESIHPEDREWVLETWERCLEEEIPYHVDMRVYRTDGALIWVNVTASEHVMPDGSLAYVGTVQDITKRREFQEQLAERERKLQFAFSTAELGLCEWDLETSNFVFNQAWADMVGLGEGELKGTGQFWLDRLHPDDVERLKAVAYAHREGQRDSYEVDFRILHSDGTYRWVKARCCVWEKDSAGRPVKSIGLYIDISDLKLASREIEEQRRFIERVAQSTPDLYCIYDYETGKTIYINREATDKTTAAAEIVQASLDGSFGQLVHPEDLDALEIHGLRMASLADGKTLELEYRVILSTGDERWLRSRDSVFERNEEGLPAQILSIVQDVTLQRRHQELYESYALQAHEARAKLELLKADLEESNAKLEESNRELSRLSTTDPLTGLLNRRYFEKSFNDQLRHASDVNEPMSVIMLDVDHFKKYNDTFGHPEGDIVLKAVSEIVCKSVPKVSSCVRYGGEEFLVVVPNCSAEEGLFIAEQIRLAMEGYRWPRCLVSASLGVATSISRISTYDLVDQADRALYTAKAMGRNQSMHYWSTGDGRAAEETLHRAS